MKKLNSKGFALVETLIVATFVMGIFTLIFTNYFPMMGEYEKRERYDDIDSVYHTYLIKKMLENSDTSEQTSELKSLSNGYHVVNCDIYSNTNYLDYCQNLFDNTGVFSIIVSKYNLKELKGKLPFSGNKGLSEYIESLPDYTNTNSYNYRIIVQYKHTINSEDVDNQYDIYSYSTIGVDL